jgi:hypothetical protein
MPAPWKILLMAVALAAAILFSYLNRPQRPQEAPMAVWSEEPAPAASLEVSPSPQASPETSPSPSRAPLIEKIPSASSLREDVKKNPHVTPRGLVAFGAEMGERMEVAKKSESAARDFLPELKSCTEQPDDKAPLQVRALCLFSASQLSKQYPNLKSSVDEIYKSADPKAVKISSMLNNPR